jgi:hypothetical protein
MKLHHGGVYPLLLYERAADDRADFAEILNVPRARGRQTTGNENGQAGERPILRCVSSGGIGD